MSMYVNQHLTRLMLSITFIMSQSIDDRKLETIWGVTKDVMNP